MNRSSVEHRDQDTVNNSGTNSGSLTDIKQFWPLVLPLIIYLPVVGGWIPFPSSIAEYSDLLITHYPNALYIKQALREFHTVPLWSPLIFSGYPFLANPLSGLWYIPGWLALIFPLPSGFGVTLALHALWGGTGCYRLIRREGVGHKPALLGALAFQAMPKFSAHLGAGHVTLLYAVYWMPWLLLASRAKRKVFYSGLVIAMIFLADPRWAAYSGLIWIAYGIAHSQHNLIRTLIDTGKSFLLSVLLTGLLWLPMLIYVRRSTRWGLPDREIFKGSLQIAELVGALFPSGGRSPESAFYLGGVILILVIYGLVHRHIREQTKFWWISGGISGIYALGSTVPGLKYITRIPGFNLLRVPARALFIFCFAGMIIAAFALDHRSISGCKEKRVRLWILGTGGSFIVLLIGLGVLLGKIMLPLLWGICALTAGLFLILSPYKYEKNPRIWLVVFALVIVDGIGAGFVNVHFRNPQRQKHSAVETWVGEQREGYGQFRTYSPSYSLSQKAGADLGLEMTDGVDPLHLREYAEFMEIATGVSYQGYSETIPSFSGAPRDANRGYKPEVSYLSVLNVKYVISAFRIPIQDLELVFDTGNQYVYQVQSPLPRAWIQPQSLPPKVGNLAMGRSEVTPAVITRWEPNRIVIEANGPGLLVLSEVAYPGWKVKIDGVRGKWKTVYDVLRGVELNPGYHTVEFRFQPSSLYAGLLLFVAGLVLAYREYNNYE